MPSNVLQEFLVSLGFKADRASADRAINESKRVEEAVVASDKRRTGESLREAAKRDAREARSRGERVKGFAEIKKELDANKKAESDAANAAVRNERAQQAARQQRADREIKLDAEAKLRRDRMTSGLRNLTSTAIATATAVEAAALSITGIAQRFAARLEEMAYASDRTKSSVASLKTFSQAVAQLGGTAGGALNDLENFAAKLRENPRGYAAFLKSVGVNARDAQGNIRGAAELYKEFRQNVGERKSYEQQLLYAQEIGVSEQTWRASDPAKLAREEAAIRERHKRMGFDPDAAKNDAMALQHAWRDMWDTIGVIGEKAASKVFAQVGDNLKRFTTFLEQHGDQIADIIAKVSQAVLAVAQALLELATSEKVKGFLDWMLGAFGKVDEGSGKWVADTEKIKDGLAALATFIATIFVAKITRAVADIRKELAPLLGILGPFLGALGIGGTAVVGAAVGTAIGADAATPNNMKPGLIGNSNELATGPEAGGMWGAIKRGYNWAKNKVTGGGSPSGSSAGNLTALIDAEAKAAGIDPRIMHGIRAGESLHTGNYDVKSDSKEDSYGPFQLNRRGGLGAAFEKETGLDVRDPKTIPDQARWVAKHIAGKLKSNPNYNPGSEWYGYKGLTNADPKWGDSGYAPSQSSGDVAGKDGAGGVSQRQSGIRSQPITDLLRTQIAAAAKEAGVNAEIYSGGQDASGPNRTGSHRHDNGQSADLKLYTTGPDGKRRYLSMNNDADRDVMEKFIRESVRAGATGVGAGPGYMGEHGIHIGGGSSAAWGAGGSTANAPNWVRRAHEQGTRLRGAAERTVGRLGDALGTVDTDKLRSFGAATQGFDPGRFFQAPPLAPNAGNTNTTQSFQGGATNVTMHVNGDGREAAEIMRRHLERQKADEVRNAASIFA